MPSTCWPTAAHLLRDHGEARALRAGAGTFNQRIERQHLHLIGDLLDRPGFLTRDLVDLGGQPGDQRGDIGFLADIVGIGRFVGDRFRPAAIRRG